MMANAMIFGGFVKIIYMLVRIGAVSHDSSEIFIVRHGQQTTVVISSTYTKSGVIDEE